MENHKIVVNERYIQVQILLQLQNQADRVIFWPNTQFVVTLVKYSEEIKLQNWIECQLIQSLEIEEEIKDIGFSQDGETMASLSRETNLPYENIRKIHSG
ncbi:unnamed protein product [Paramecium octaurelia]|uniref:Uncharacterized protein n=1 Tax=Paramecium octaurelia TaxID=43137 RepID=A0A8S1UR34_PAROT|nr:unnamed protein product [Paramecium octaurelia]